MSLNFIKSIKLQKSKRELILLLILVMAVSTIVVSLFLTHFKLFGYIRTIFARPDAITDYFDENNPNNDPEYYIASKENLVISGGQVKLVDVCYGMEDNTQVPGCDEPCRACQGGSCENVAECENCYGCVGSCAWCYEGTCYSCDWTEEDSFCYHTQYGTPRRCKPSINSQLGFKTGSYPNCTESASSSYLGGQPASTCVYYGTCTCE